MRLHNNRTCLRHKTVAHLGSMHRNGLDDVCRLLSVSPDAKRDAVHVLRGGGIRLAAINRVPDPGAIRLARNVYNNIVGKGPRREIEGWCLHLLEHLERGSLYPGVCETLLHHHGLDRHIPYRGHLEWSHIHLRLQRWVFAIRCEINRSSLISIQDRYLHGTDVPGTTGWQDLWH